MFLCEGKGYNIACEQKKGLREIIFKQTMKENHLYGSYQLLCANLLALRQMKPYINVRSSRRIILASLPDEVWSKDSAVGLPTYY